MTELVLRKATRQDAEKLFSWRNDPKTREFFIDPEPITWEQHERWFIESIQSDDRHLLIGEIDNQPIGVLRFDTLDSVAEISIYLIPSLQDKGLGGCLLEEGCRWVHDHLPHLKKLQAKVLPRNQKSAKVFENSGFVESLRVFEYNISQNSL